MLTGVSYKQLQWGFHSISVMLARQHYFDTIFIKDSLKNTETNIPKPHPIGVKSTSRSIVNARSCSKQTHN